MPLKKAAGQQHPAAFGINGADAKATADHEEQDSRGRGGEGEREQARGGVPSQATRSARSPRLTGPAVSAVSAVPTGSVEPAAAGVPGRVLALRQPVPESRRDGAPVASTRPAPVVAGEGPGVASPAARAGAVEATAAPAEPSAALIGQPLVIPGWETETEARKVTASRRGKRDYNYSWPKADIAVMEQAFKAYRVRYRDYWEQVEPDAEHRLVWSTFLAAALARGLEHPEAWRHSIRNDARKEPVPGGRRQVGVTWPVGLERAVVRAWESLDVSDLGEDFHVTKQHFVAAAILYGLRSVEEWILKVPNDARFIEPHPADRRLRQNKDRPEQPDPLR